MPAWLVALAAFVVGAIAIGALGFGIQNLPVYLLRRRIEQRIADTSLSLGTSVDEPTVVRREDEGPLPGLERALARTQSGGGLARLIQQSGSRTTVTTVVLASLLCAVVFAFLTAVAIRFPLAPVVGALVGLATPFMLLRHRRTLRTRRFEEQFPEALDLLSRAIRAGHAFTTAMGMVASEAPDPIGPEFRKTYDEQNFGLPLKEALSNLGDRVPLLDVRFFATAVLIQRETGGNLSEILDNLARVVRERFKILRQVRVHTAHGRFTGYVLLALPAFLAVALSMINPDHMQLLFREHLGQMMLLTAIVMQVVGYFWIRQVIKIEV